MLGERLPILRPAPVIALTATATPRVQKDICKQLGLEDPILSIHGFRRENIAIEVVELTPKQRVPALIKLLEDRTRRPAIIYAPTRKAAEQQAAELAAHFPVMAYHAGMTGSAREDVQSGFLSGKYDAIVATIAFGMGIDKANVRTVIHTGLPGSVEGYYQEIGRAGRDGLPSAAVLMHSWNDRRTHEFFMERDYPPLPEVEKTGCPQSRNGNRDRRRRPLGRSASVRQGVERLGDDGTGVAQDSQRARGGQAVKR
jgi:RecQ family ATP-dependent DNA helicase